MTQGGLYLFTGPDRSRKRERLKTLAQELQVHPLDRHDVVAEHLSATALLRLARAYPAASPVRLLVIDEADRLDRACLDALANRAKLLSQTACLILLVDQALDATHPLASLKPYVSVEHFEVPTARRNDFALLEAIGKRDSASALQALAQQLAGGKEELKIVGFLVWRIQQWLTAAHFMKAGVSQERLAALLGIRPWHLARLVGELSGRSLESLRDVLQACWALDVAAKRGRVPNVRAALEQVIVELCLPDSDRARRAGVPTETEQERLPAPTAVVA